MSTPLERFREKFGYEIVESLFEYACSEGYEKPRAYAKSKEKELEGFLLSELSLKEQETIEKVRWFAKTHVVSRTKGNYFVDFVKLSDFLSTLTNEKR